MTGLPSGWMSGPLSDFIMPRGEKVLPADRPELPFIGMDHVEAHTTRIIGSIPAARMKSSASRFSKGDVLYGRLRPYLNKVAQPQFDGLASAEFIVFSGNELIEARFLLHRLNSQDFVNFASHLNEGDRPRVAFDQIGDFQLLVPPPTEQRRIVARIEAVFDEIDQGVGSLRAAKSAIDFYRRSLLKSAFEGSLTADWRAENADRLESPEALLARIQNERDARYMATLENWYEELATWRAGGEKGKKPAKPKRPKNYPSELTNLRISLPDLPFGWTWAHLGWCSMGPEYGTAAKSSNEGAVPVIRMGNLQRGRIDWGSLAFTSNPDEIDKYSLHSGDVLFNRTNSPDLVGKTSIYKGERPALFAGYLVRVNQVDEIASGPYVNYFLNSPLAREYGNTVKTDGVNQSNINGTKLQEYPFPHCSSAEQAVIVNFLDAKLNAADAMEAEIDVALTHADVLRQSILKKAFSGGLVSQDPSDESVSALLDRINAEHAPASVAKKQRSTHA